MSFILEQNFYNKTKGFPLEDPLFAGFSFGCNLNEFDSFGIITNSFPMYVRVFPLKGGCQDGHCISKEGRYANLDSETRDKECPKIAWGFSAYLFSQLCIIVNGEIYNRKDHNYIINKNEDINYQIDEAEVKECYLNILWDDYKRFHSGTKFRNISEKRKRVSFLKQHINDEKLFWKQTESVLKAYLCTSTNQKASKLLYDSIEFITNQYLKEIKKQKNDLKYNWICRTKNFVKKHTIKIISGICAALLAYIYRDFAIMLYHYICKLIETY